MLTFFLLPFTLGWFDSRRPRTEYSFACPSALAGADGKRTPATGHPPGWGPRELVRDTSAARSGLLLVRRFFFSDHGAVVVGAPLLGPGILTGDLPVASST